MTARLVTCFVGRVVSDFNSQRKKVIRQTNSEEDVKVNTELSLSMMVQFGLVSLFDKRRINQEIKNMPRKRILFVCSTYSVHYETLLGCSLVTEPSVCTMKPFLAVLW